jgi:hypothetical protein
METVPRPARAYYRASSPGRKGGLSFTRSRVRSEGGTALLFVGIAAHGCIALSGEIALFLALHARRQIGRSRLPMSDRGVRDARRRRGCQGALRCKRTLGRYDCRETDPGGERDPRDFELSRAMDTPP